MKILHFYPDTESMITQYINMLSSAMAENEFSVETHTASDMLSFRKKMNAIKPDIVHLHGCWNMKTAIASHTANKRGIRTVITLHGQLEQWIIKQHYWKEKLPKILVYQRRTVRNAYALIAMGRMEKNGLCRMGWNSRIETVRNPLITESISIHDAVSQIYAIYRKVLDTDVIKLMDEVTLRAIRPLVKAGITGNHRWLDDSDYNLLKHPEDINWRQIQIYAAQNEILHTIRKGIEILGIDIPYLEVGKIAYFQPDKFTPTASLNTSTSHSATSDANGYITDILRQAAKLASSGKLTISHIIEITSALLSCNIAEDKVAENLYEARLTETAGRLMQIASDLTGLDEGFMPIPALNDRKTKSIYKSINRHLEI